MALHYQDDGDYRHGMIRDTPSWLLPKGAVYDSSNLIYDRPGIARLRMPTTAVSASSPLTAFMTSLGFCRSDDATRIEELYGLDGKTGTLYLINKTTAVNTSLGTAGAATAIVGRPVRHFGFLIFPSAGVSGTLTRTSVVVAGQTTTGSFTSTATASVAAGNPQVTLSGADVTTNIKVGGVVFLSNSTNQHYARVVSVDSGTKFSVWPAPIFTDAAVPIGDVVTKPFLAVDGGACVTSFQNRLLYGNTTDASTTSDLITDRRIYYSPLPTESDTFGVAAGLSSGATFVNPALWPRLNYIDVAIADPIIAMEPVADNQLLILTGTHPVILSGNLVTQLATTNPTITFDVSEVNHNASCISDLGVQRTTLGPMWAGFGGIYAWNGRDAVDLTDKKINTYWRSLVRGSSFAIHGSAYVRNHYIVSGSSGGATFILCVNLDTLAWTRLAGASTDIFYGAARPTDPSQVFAARWWDQAGAAPSMAHGQLFRLESMFESFVAPGAPTDGDGTTMTFTVTSRVLGGDTETQKLQQRATVRYQYVSDSIISSVTAQTKTDAADISADSVRTLGGLSNTGVLTITGATNANPIVITTLPVTGSGLQDDDFVDINGVGGNTNANGRWRIKRLTGTTLSLVGGIGNGAYTSGGTLKKLTETDFLTSSLDAGQGVSIKITSSGDVYNFELHGLRVAFYERQPVMSA